MKNSFVVEYAVHLLIASMNISGPFAALIAYLAKTILGELLDRGIIELDIQIDKLKEGLKSDQWKDAIEKAYAKASSKVYTEEEKNAIRQEYLDAIRKYAYIRVSNN